MKLLEWEGALPKESNEEYHQRASRSSSQIKEIKKSPWHYKCNVIDGNAPEKAVLDFGNLSHSLIHEGEFRDYTSMPDYKPIKTLEMGKRGKLVGKTFTKKAQQEKFLEENLGKKIISFSDYQKLQGMSVSYLADEEVQKYIEEDDIIEQGYEYWDPLWKVRCRFKPDRWNPRTKTLIDYKTTKSAKPTSFSYSIRDYGYHISSAHYWIGLCRLFGPGAVTRIIYLSQEKSHPYTCGVYELSEIDLLRGEQERFELMKKIEHYTKVNRWPGYTPTTVKLSVPEDYSAAIEDISDETEEFKQDGF